MPKAGSDTQQQESFKDLLNLQDANSGKLMFKYMTDQVDKYKTKRLRGSLNR